MNDLTAHVMEWRVEAAIRRQIEYAYPKTQSLVPYRLTTDGCIAILEGNFFRARALLERAHSLFTESGSRQDCLAVLLYLAYCCYQERQLLDFQQHLAKALALAKGFQLPQAPEIEILAGAGTALVGIADRLLTEAVKAGGCLGPKTEAR